MLGPQGNRESPKQGITSASSFQCAYVRNWLAPVLGQVCSMRPITSMPASRPPGSTLFGRLETLRFRCLLELVSTRIFVSLEKMRNFPV